MPLNFTSTGCGKNPPFVDQLAMETRVKVSNDKLTRRKIEIRPNPAAKERQKLPHFPNFPQLYPESNSTQLEETIKDNDNKTETLPQAQPFTMSKSESRYRHKNHNNKARRKIDSIPINLTPTDPYRKSPYTYDYYEDYDYYYDDYYEDVPPKQKLPNFRPLATKPPPPPPPPKKVNYQTTRKSPPKSSR